MLITDLTITADHDRVTLTGTHAATRRYAVSVTAALTALCLWLALVGLGIVPRTHGEQVTLGGGLALTGIVYLIASAIRTRIATVRHRGPVPGDALGAAPGETYLCDTAAQATALASLMQDAYNTGNIERLHALRANSRARREHGWTWLDAPKIVSPVGTHAPSPREVATARVLHRVNALLGALAAALTGWVGVDQLLLGHDSWLENLVIGAISGAAAATLDRWTARKRHSEPAMATTAPAAPVHTGPLAPLMDALALHTDDMTPTEQSQWGALRGSYLELEALRVASDDEIGLSLEAVEGMADAEQTIRDECTRITNAIRARREHAVRGLARELARQLAATNSARN